MPKLGMGPIRTEQICRAAASVIAQHGFDRTTMRVVAERAGCSTGMVNHYFSNRMDLLEKTLSFVSSRQQEREREAMEGLEPGVERLRALIRAILPSDAESMENFRVWIAALGASVTMPRLRAVMTDRTRIGLEIVEHALEGIVPPDTGRAVRFAMQLDAIIAWLPTISITTETKMEWQDIEDAIVERALEHGAARGPASPAVLAGS